MRFLFFCCSIFLTASLGFAAADLQVIETVSPYKGSRLFIPNDNKTHPGIFLLHGSGGGSERRYDTVAQELAFYGFSVFLYCYNDCGRTVDEPRVPLDRIEVSAIYDAYVWFKESNYNKNSKTAIYGFSRGAELALVLTAQMAILNLQQPDVVVAHSPADTYLDGWNWSWGDVRCWICKPGADDKGCTKTSVIAWVEKIIAFATVDDIAKTESPIFKWNPFCGPAPQDMSVESNWLWRGKAFPLGTKIPLEKTKGPFFISVGLEDQAWSPDQTRRIEKDLNAFSIPHEVHYFEHEGHSFSIESEKQRKTMVLEFLKKNLK